MRGGSRPGAGRKSGAAWNGTGSYEPVVRLNVGLPPELYRWLRVTARRRGVAMSALVVGAVAALRSQQNDN